MIDAASTLVDVAFAVCDALAGAGVTAVMSGGSAATFYAPDACQSDDVDFIITFGGGPAAVDALERLGYLRRGDYYEHPTSRFPLEFPSGPLMVGEDLIGAWATERRGSQVLHVLTATDSCRDRLAQFLFWNDFSALEQALAICRAQRAHVDLELVRAWCIRERQPEKHGLFVERLRRMGLT